MEQEITKLGQEISELRKEIIELKAIVTSLSQSTQRMDTHIDFVEQTYNTLRSPLDFIRNRFEGGAPPLPPPPTEN